MEGDEYLFEHRSVPVPLGALTRAPEAVDELRDLSHRAMSGDSKAALSFLEKITEGTAPSPAPKGSKETSRGSRVC